MNTAYYVTNEDYSGDYEKIIKAHDHYQAAEIYAEIYDHDGDYSLSSGHEELISVRDSDGEIKRFTIRVYQTTVYQAREI